MSRWLRSALWLQVASLLSPYTAVVFDTAVHGPGGCGELGCGHAHAAEMAVALEVYSIPTAVVLTYAFGGSRISGGRLAWLLATDAWLLAITSFALQLSQGLPVFTIPGTLIIALAIVSAAGGITEWVKLRGVGPVTTLNT